MPYSRHIAAKTTLNGLTTYEVFLTGEQYPLRQTRIYVSTGSTWTVF